MIHIYELLLPIHGKKVSLDLFQNSTSDNEGSRKARGEEKCHEIENREELYIFD